MSFLNQYGILVPFRRLGGSDYKNGTDEELIESNIKTILMTRAEGSFRGELPWRHGFGSWLKLLRHKKNNSITAALAQEWAKDAIAKWEPRAQITGINVSTRQGSDKTTLIIDVMFRIRNIVNRQQGERTVRVEI